MFPGKSDGDPPEAGKERRTVTREERRNGRRKGLVIVYTGHGKGKTTAALGTMIRAWGHGMRVCMIQFLKSETGKWGEVRAARKMEGIEWISTGDGWTWRSKDMDETTARALRGWEIAREKIASGDYDLIILDEFTYALAYGWLDLQEVINWLKANKPDDLHLIITGRDAPTELTTYADLVTNMSKIKHPFDEGIMGQPGIEF
ncbi:MAG TPA: cob(I)yrinic acid a,c-diamide adenosyltransferase [Chloroflexi bacterium]|nr:cob(I)yrinic acid a,c-diamide adenosyltransferase [Chloroflexota bacterium]